jgi:glutamate decarboxylase
MIAHLFHAPLEDGKQAIGASTIGSSEAVMLAGLAMKRKWQLERRAAGKPCDKPNFVCGANVHVSARSTFPSSSPHVHNSSLSRAV